MVCDDCLQYPTQPCAPSQWVYRADQQFPKFRINGIIYLRLLRGSPFGPPGSKADFRLSPLANGSGCLQVVLSLSVRVLRRPLFRQLTTPKGSGERKSPWHDPCGHWQKYGAVFEIMA